MAAADGRSDEARIEDHTLTALAALLQPGGNALVASEAAMVLGVLTLECAVRQVRRTGLRPAV